MVRLVIEDKAWGDPRLKRLAAELGVSKEEALARLLTLWHGSQSEGLIDCDESELKVWYETTADLAPLVAALIKSRYLKTTVVGRYTIAGNAAALKDKKKRSERAKSAAVGRWKVEGVDELIGHYVNTFKAKFSGQNPVITGKEAGAARNLVKTLGLERAKAAVTGFFQLRDAYFMNKLYPLSELQNASVLNKIAVAESTGIEVNATMARKAEAVSTNQNVAMMWLKAKQARGGHEIE
jgi:hypothetical protein